MEKDPSEVRQRWEPSLASLFLMHVGSGYMYHFPAGCCVVRG